jgi:hypothetical protein
MTSSFLHETVIMIALIAIISGIKDMVFFIV